MYNFICNSTRRVELKIDKLPGNLSLQHFSISAQPDDTTCGPTCLHAVYKHFGLDLSLDQLIAETHQLSTGGTLGAFLGIDALQRGFSARLHTFNLRVMDPTWKGLEPEIVRAKLAERCEAISDSKLQSACRAYARFLELGGVLIMEDLKSNLITKSLRDGYPLLCGLSGTWLYQSPREYGPESDWDDVRGDPQGHFVVLCGYDTETRMVQIADPLEDRPGFESHVYTAPVERVISAILLGVLTFDGNLLQIRLKQGRKSVR